MMESLKRILAHDDALLNKAAITFMVRSGGAAAAFGMNIAVARLLGVAEAGIFFLSLTLVMAASVVTIFGMDNTLMRFISPAWEQGNHAHVLGLSLQGLGVTGGLGVIVTFFLYLSADFLAYHIFNEPSLAGVIRLMSFVVVPFSLLCVLGGILKAIRLPAKASFVEAGILPLVVVVILTAFLFYESHITSETAAIVYLFAAVLGMFVGLVFFFMRMPKLEQPILISFNKLSNSARSLMWVAILNFAIMWSSSIFLGIFSNAEAVGLYNVAQRTATLIAFILLVFNGITAPRFASLYSDGKLMELERLAVRTALLMTVAAFPLLLSILLVPEWILSIFGLEYTSAAILLVIISIGQFVNVITGSVGYLLMMTGNERAMRNNVFFTAALSMVLNVVLVKTYGALGAAITTAVCLSVQNLIAAWLVYQRLGVCTIPGWRYLWCARSV